MLYRYLLSAFLFAFSIISASAQEQNNDSLATLRGCITDPSGDPIPGVIVTDEASGQRAVSDIDGRFVFRQPVGSDDLFRFESVGYVKRQVPLSQADTRNKDGVAFFNIVLKENLNALQEVEVVGRTEKSYKNSMTFSGTKTETALKDIPQSLGYVTKELVLDQGATTVNDVVKNISGVSQYTFYNDFSIRGFRTTGNRNSGNLVNGMRAQTSLWKQSSLINIERVEVIKGPASALFGNAAPGGVINRVTKKPLLSNRRMVSASVGSWGLLRGMIDFTGPMNKEKTLLYRLNAGYDGSNTFRDLQGYKTYVVAPSFSYIPSEKTQFNFDIVYQYNNAKVDRGQAVFGDGPLTSRPISSSLSAANDYLHENLINVTLGFTHKFTKNLTFNSTYLASVYDEDLMEHNQSNAYVALADGTTDPTKVLMQCLIRKRHFINNSVNNYFTYTAKTGIFQHKLLLGYDYFQTEMKNSSQSLANGYLLKNGKTTTKFDKAKIANYVLDQNGNPKTNVSPFDLTNNSGNAIQDISKYVYVSSVLSPYKQYSHGIYLQEQLDFWRLKFLFGLRQEWFTDVLDKGMASQTITTQHAFLPRIGVVATVNKHINLYATWLKGFEPQSAATQADPNKGGPFDPESSQLIEGGAKTEWFDGRLSATAAVYRLVKKNTLYNAGDAGNPDLMEQVGEEVAKGVELDVAGSILPNWNIVASYSFIDAKITKTKTGQERDFGQQRPNTPRHSANLWTKYIVDRGPLRNLGVGLGMNTVSMRNGQVGKRTNTITYPGYTLFNAALYYRVKSIQMQANLNNVFNKTYWVGGYDRLRSFPGAPRNVSLTVSYVF